MHVHCAFMFNTEELLVCRVKLDNVSPLTHMSKRKLLKSTSTSAFGSPGREGHDSSPFYNTRLYADQPQAESETYLENPLAGLDVIFNHSSEAMGELPDCSVHLMVTSPPYN